MVNGEWRETSAAFFEYLNQINEQPFRFLKLQYETVLYVDNTDNKCAMDEYMKSFVELFQTMAGIKKKQYCLIFLPDIDNYLVQQELVNRIIDELANRDIMLLYRAKSYKELINNNFALYDTFKVTYNSRMNICEFYNFEQYLNGLTSKRRRFLKKSLDTFNRFETLSLRKFNIGTIKKRALYLYTECCKLHGDFIECDKFLNNIELAKNVDWYGVFEQDELIMFSGCWKNRDSVVLGMFGKDYRKEQMIRDSYAYFALNLKMIENAINNGINTIYNSFGECDIKKRMGYEIDEYFIMVRPYC